MHTSPLFISTWGLNHICHNSLQHWILNSLRPGIMASPWILAGCLICWATTGTPVYSFSSLRSLALGLVTLMASWAALSTMALRFLEETLWAISAQYDLKENGFANKEQASLEHAHCVLLGRQQLSWLCLQSNRTERKCWCVAADWALLIPKPHPLFPRN